MGKVFSLNEIIAAMERKKYKVFKVDYKPYNLNIVGIRAADKTPNVFNDYLWVFWYFKGGCNINFYRITTDPGLYYLKNPINQKGTAILKPGQYLDVWEIGKHRGEYEALVQTGYFTIIRDFNRDGKYDYDSGREETGKNFGINLHHAGEDSKTIDKWSAGCQVFARIEDFNDFMVLARKARDNWGNSFSYTLLKEEEI